MPLPLSYQLASPHSSYQILVLQAYVSPLSCSFLCPVAIHADPTPNLITLCQLRDCKLLKARTGKSQPFPRASHLPTVLTHNGGPNSDVCSLSPALGYELSEDEGIWYPQSPASPWPLASAQQMSCQAKERTNEETRKLNPEANYLQHHPFCETSSPILPRDELLLSGRTL